MIQYIVPRARKYRLVPQIWNMILQTSPRLKEVHGAWTPHAAIVRHNDYVYYAYPVVEWEALAQALLTRCLSDPTYVRRCHERSMTAGAALEQYAQRVLNEVISAWSEKELLDAWERVQNLWIELDIYNVPPWYVMGPVLSDHVRERHPELAKEEFDFGSTPQEMPWTTREELDRLAGKQEDAERLAERYFWIPYGYDGPELWDSAYYRIHAGEGKPERREEVKRYYDLVASAHKRIKEQVQSDWHLFQDLQLLAVMTDERKRFAFQGNAAWGKIAAELFERRSIPEARGWLLLEEVRSLPIEKQRATAHRRANSDFAFEFEASVPREADDPAALIAEIVPTEGEEVRGTVACATTSRVRGIARVLFSTTELDRVQNGDILITPMTTPDFVPAMRRAAAIVTDEGGVTCHAAIVSRELGIPCIIGTGHATRTIKDGDLVEVDANHGIVRKVAEK